MSERATACPKCGASFTETFGTQVGPSPKLPERPEKVTCIGDDHHEFPVFKLKRTSGGQPLYTLGPEIKSDA